MFASRGARHGQRRRSSGCSPSDLLGCDCELLEASARRSPEAEHGTALGPARGPMASPHVAPQIMSPREAGKHKGVFASLHMSL